MALHQIDGFGLYNDPSQRWLQVNGTPEFGSVHGRLEGRGMRLPFNFVEGVLPNPPGVDDQVTIGFALRVAGPGLNNFIEVLSLYDAVRERFRLSFTGSLKPVMSVHGQSHLDPNWTLAGIESHFLDGRWHYVEVSAIVSNEGVPPNVVIVYGVKVWVDDVLVIDLAKSTSPSSELGFMDRWKLGRTSLVGSDVSFDDVYLDDDQTQRHGDVRAPPFLPEAAGNYAAWTPTVAPNWNTVNEVIPNTEDFVGSATLNQRDSYVFPDSGVVGNVKAVQAVARGKGGAVDTVQRYSGTDNNAALGHTYGSNFETKLSMFLLNAIGGAWTPAIFDATEFGIQRK